MPGHKGRDGFDRLDEIVLQWDVTEIDGMDNLHKPQGAILEIEHAYADTFDARHSFLLVNGSSVGIHAMMLAVGLNKRILVARDCHKAAVAGIALAGHSVDFVYPESDHAMCLYGMVSAEAVNSKLNADHYDAVFITSPNYYGVCADISAITAVCRKHNTLLLVDAAHAAHFPFIQSMREHLPIDADMYCVSAHKTLSALTQAAILHVNRCCAILDERIRSILSMLQTTSPSYLLMASLDWALFQAKNARWPLHLERVMKFRERIAAINGINVLDESCVGHCSIAAIDPTRLTIRIYERGITGYEAAASLESHRVIPEMADIASVVLITSPVDPDEWYERLYEALIKLPYGTKKPVHTAGFNIQHAPPKLSVRDAMLGRQAEPMPLNRCAGRIAACVAGFYPPGVVAFFPGEVITDCDINALLTYSRAGLSLFGVIDGMVSCVAE